MRKLNLTKIASLALSLLLAIGVFFGAYTFGVTVASADETLPVITDGSKLEMETVTPNGTPSDLEQGFILNRDGASEGWCIGNWKHGDTNVTYKFTVEKATKAKIGIALVTGWGGTGLTVRVNGEDVAFADAFDPFTDYANGWYKFKVYYLNEVVLNAGENSIYIEAHEGSNFNFDYFVFDFTEEIATVPTIKDGDRLEVETVNPNGRPTGDNDVFIFDKESASGGAVIGNWGRGDNNVTYTFNVEKATKAKIGLALVTGWGGTDLIVKVNGQSVSFVDSFDPFTDWSNGWYNFKVYYLEEVVLNEGENTIFLEAYEGHNFNFDYFVFDFTEEIATVPTIKDGDRLEVETVYPNGTPTDPNDVFVFDKETASGGKVIGNWGMGDNNVTYKFNVAEATKAKIGIALVTGWGGTNLIVKVNDQSLSFVDSFDPFTDWSNGWYNFKVYYLNEVELLEGENSIYLEAYEGSNFNFDYFIFDFIHECENVCPECGKCTDSACAEPECANKCEGHLPLIADGDRIEIESVNPNGTPTDGNPTFIFDKATASGGAVIGNWGNGDTSVTYKFNVAEATKAKIGIALVTGWGGTDLWVAVNGERVYFADSFDPFTDWSNGWYNFKVYYLNEVELNAGENSIYIEAYEGSRFNFDYIIFDFVEDAPVVPPHACESVCPECGKCLDAECAESVCADKCQGHVVAPAVPTIKDGDKLEMETVTPSGTPGDLEQGFILNRDGASEGWCIGNWKNGDTNVTYKFNVEKATKAKIGIALVTGWGGTNLIVRVNGVDVAFADAFDPFTDYANGWYNFKVYYLNEVELLEGENTIYIEAYDGCNFNFDYFIFDFVETLPVVEDGSKIEMESVTPNGTPTDTDQGFILNRDGASEGWCIGNWGNGDTNVTYKFNVAEATKAKIGIALVTGWTPTNLIVKVNGVDVAFADAFDPFTDYANGWYNFKVYYLNEVQLNAGENSIYIEAYDGNKFNFDYIIFDFVEDAPVVPPHACESVCPECGKCLDAECAESVCAEKCQGHTVVEPTIPTINDGDRIEVETVYPNGTPTDINDVFVFDKATASGGKVIGNWGRGDNNVTYKFNVAEATKAKIGIALVTGWYGTDLIVKVNGEDVSFERGFDAFDGNWYGFKVYYLNEVQLNAGENSIYLGGVEGSSFNFDYIIFDFVEGGDTPVVPPHACESVCPECGKCLDASCAESVCADKCQGHTAVDPTIPTIADGDRIEVESVTPSGTPTDINDVFVFDKATASGGKVIGNWGRGDNNVTYKFNVAEATKAKIGIALVTGWGAGTDLIVKVNGVDVSFADSFPGFGGDYYAFSVYYLNEVQLNAGENSIYIEAYEGHNFNFDYIIFDFVDGSDTPVDPPIVDDPTVYPDHDHEFVGGFCACGSFKVEMESVTPNGTTTDPDQGFVLNRDGCSEGWCIGNWGNSDTNVTYTFTVSKGGKARIGIALVTGWGGTGLDVKVNGQSVSFADSFDPFTDWASGWYKFKVYYLNEVELVEGENTLYIGAVDGCGFNFDYFVVEFGEGGSGVNPNHTHNFENGSCSCGGFILEAEDTNWQDTIVSTDQSGNNDIIEPTDNASGGWIVGNWGLAGNKIVWEVDFPETTEGYIILYMAPCSEAAQFSNVLRLTVNGVEVSLVDDNIPGLVGSNWYDIQAFDTYSMEVPAGKVTIVLEMIVDGYFCNVDCIALIPGKNLGASDFTPPKVGDIEFGTKLEAGSEVEIDVDISDNVTAADKINVTTKVYYNYGKADQEEIPTNGLKFTPEKAGRYTVIITATDAKGNKTTKTRSFTVYEEGTYYEPEIPDAPVDPNPPVEDDPTTPDKPNDNQPSTEGGIFDAFLNWEPVAGWPIKVFAWETAGTAFAIAAAVAFVLYVLKAWVFGRLILDREERKYARELTRDLKKESARERREALKDEHKRIRKVVKWNLGGRIRWNAVIALIVLIATIAVPVLTTTLPYIQEALNPTNSLNPDSEAAKLAIGEAKENVVKIAEEGVVLLKNESGVLPLDPKSESDVKVNLFGSSVFGMLYGGGGSGVFVTNATSYGNELYATRLEDALETEGFQYNKDLYNLVANYYESKTYKITETDYDISCQNNVYGANTMDDKGNILIGATKFPYDNEPEASAYNKTYDGLNGKTLLEAAKEYSDIAIYAVSRAGSEDGDLRYTNTILTSREMDMINLLKDNFSRVIILINSSNTMELGILEDAGVDAVLWVGHPGLTGNTAVAGIISGRINPSGKMVDTWPYSGSDNPASLMFGHEGTEYYSNKGTPFQVYYEGVYLGYRYYVTRALTDDTYIYDEHVQYSFGEGMSYTTYEKHITDISIDPDKDLVSIQVAVTNTGDMAGKEVVQIYFNAPYTGLIEKPYYELAGFAKTDVIQPGETYYARVEFAFSDMSSWYSGYNNGKGAYVLEAGEYKISLRENVWEIAPDANKDDEFVNEHTYTLAEAKAITTDPVTGNTVENRFEDVEYGPNDQALTYLSRSNWSGTFPTEDKINKVASSAVLNSKYVQSYTQDNLISSKDTSEYTQGANNGLVIRDFKGIALDGSITKDGKTYTWDDLIDQMTIDDMCKLVDSRFMGTVKIESVGKPEMGDDDGPASVSIYGVGYPSEVVVASTWNTDMAYLLGYSLGKEGAAMGMSGWYAPGLNLHRSAAGGRNFEYYSEDPLISGLMAAGSIKGAAKFGVYTYIKHYALNDQETERRTIQVWANEQSMRELYLRAFEIAIKEGGSVGIMSSFNFIGSTWAGGSKALMNDVLREEWGFEGVAVTDWTNPGTMPVNAGLRAGNDLWLGKNSAYSAKSAYNETPDDVHFLLRQACKRILYAAANSNAVWTAEEYKAVGIDTPPTGNHEALDGYH